MFEPENPNPVSWFSWVCLSFCLSELLVFKKKNPITVVVGGAKAWTLLMGRVYFGGIFACRKLTTVFKIGY